MNSREGFETEKYSIKVNTVAPIVLYLCSDSCAEAGLIVNAGGGFFNRAAMVSGPGLTLGDGQRVPTPEEIHQNWDKIDALAGAQEFPNANAALMTMLTPPSSLQSPISSAQPSKEAKAQTVTVQAVFERMSQVFQADKAAGVDVVFQFRISGPGGGDWYAVVKDKTCAVRAGIHDKPTTTLKMAGEDFLKLVAGQLPAMQAYTSGKLKIEGDLMKSQLVTKLFKF